MRDKTASQQNMSWAHLLTEDELSSPLNANHNRSLAYPSTHQYNTGSNEPRSPLVTTGAESTPQQNMNWAHPSRQHNTGLSHKLISLLVIDTEYALCNYQLWRIWGMIYLLHPNKKLTM
jgi:hypothetical protein